MRVVDVLKKELEHELGQLNVRELEALIHNIHAELERRTAAAPVSEDDLMHALNFELKKHRKRKEEVFNPFA